MEFDRARAKYLIEELFHITAELQRMTGRKFTLDGHLVGSLGEVLAARDYGLTLEESQSSKACDAKDSQGRRIEIKATFGKTVAFRRHEADCEADLCLVLLLKRSADFEEVYNGPMQPILDALKLRVLPSNGQLHIRLTRLRELHAEVKPSNRLPRVVD